MLGAIMMLEMYLPSGLGMGVAAPLLLIQATIVQLWAGATFYKTAWASARHGGTNMSTLVAALYPRHSMTAFVTLLVCESDVGSRYTSPFLPGSWQ